MSRCRRCRARTASAAAAASPCSASREISIRPSVTFDSAETTTTGAFGCLRTISTSRRTAATSFTDVPPNFITTMVCVLSVAGGAAPHPPDPPSASRE